jgi:hypothetical protein
LHHQVLAGAFSASHTSIALILSALDGQTPLLSLTSLRDAWIKLHSPTVFVWLHPENLTSYRVQKQQTCTATLVDSYFSATHTP